MSWRDKKCKDDEILLNKWNKKFKLFIELKCRKCYKQFTNNDNVSPT